MKKTILAIFVIASFVLMAGVAFAVNGAAPITEISSSSMANIPAGNHTALAGNVTELDINSDTSTQTWAGYFGNVSGTIQLQDSSGNTMYNWSTDSPAGTVLASVNQTVEWSQIGCASNANITALETAYTANGSDSITNTFNAATEDLTIASQSLSSCKATQIFDEQGASSADFKELLLWDGDAAVFASKLNQDVMGFDNRTHDFEMLVLEDGHNNADTETYYFFVELN